MQKFNSKTLAYTAICIALATILQFVKIIELPQGGSVTLFSMFFITFIGYMFGPVAGIAGGFAFGLLQLALGAHIYYPVQAVLDYPVAFAALGFSGFFTDEKDGLMSGYVVGCVLRLIVHVISGYVFFSEYTPEGMNALIYSIGYNASYISVEMALTLVVLVVAPVKQAVGMVRRGVA